MSRKRKNNFDMSAIRNGLSYRFYLDRLINMSVSMFEWENLPDSCDARYIETRLFSNGAVVFFEDPDLKISEDSSNLVALDMVPTSGFNVYGYPTKYDAYSAFNHYRKSLDLNNSVICYNNYMRLPSYDGALYYAKRLWFLDSIVDINANAQKTPLLLQGNEKERLTLLNLYKEYDGNSPVVHANKNLNLEGFSVLKTDAPYVADKISELKNIVWNEAMTYLGISNVSYQKKERLISDEVTRSMGGTIASRYSRLNARQEAAEKVNAMFGTNIKVHYREESEETPPDPADSEVDDV